jgi:hypothetical protein
MTTRSQAEVIDDSVEPSLEDLFYGVLTSTRLGAGLNGGDGARRALTTAAMATLSRVPQASPTGRALFVEVLSPVLADALASGLAKVLAPGVAKVLSHLADGAESAEGKFDEAFEELKELAYSEIAVDCGCSQAEGDGPVGGDTDETEETSDK